jgi:hypothetical protein
MLQRVGHEHWILRERAMSTEFYSERAMNGDEEITNVDCKHNYSLSASSRFLECCISINKVGLGDPLIHADALSGLSL